MKKIYCAISACPDSYSGYGRRSLDVIKELLRLRPDWNIEILSQRWGDTRRGYLEDHEEWEVISHIVNSLTRQPDVWIQITVPNEFTPVGKYNIGITAAMETNLVDSSWIEGCNRMNLVLTSSEHGRQSLIGSTYSNQQTGQVLRVTTPVKVLFEGIDSSIYFKEDEPKKSPVLADLKNSWNFLCMGHWMQGIFGEDRKNIGYTIKAFLETFKDQDKAPGLVLKTSQAIASNLDKEVIVSRIYEILESVQYTKKLPSIYLLHGDLTDAEINSVYNDPRIKAMVSFTKGEGYGRPLAEFASIGKPIVVSGWSGHRDFLDEKYTMYVGGTLEKVHPSAVQPHMILAEASWFRPNDGQAMAGLREMFNNYPIWLKKAEIQGRNLSITRNLGAMGELLDTILEENVPDFPEKVELVIPGISQ